MSRPRGRFGLKGSLRARTCQAAIRTLRATADLAGGCGRGAWRRRGRGRARGWSAARPVGRLRSRPSAVSAIRPWRARRCRAVAGLFDARRQAGVAAELGRRSASTIESRHAAGTPRASSSPIALGSRKRLSERRSPHWVSIPKVRFIADVRRRKRCMRRLSRSRSAQSSSDAIQSSRRARARQPCRSYMPAARCRASCARVRAAPASPPRRAGRAPR